MASQGGPEAQHLLLLPQAPPVMLLQAPPEILLHPRWRGLGTPIRSVFIVALLHPRWRGLGIPIRSVSILHRS